MAVVTAYDVHPSGAGVRLPVVQRLPDMAAELTFGELTRRYRKVRRITQEELAVAAKTDKGTISEIENDIERKPGHDLAQRIIVALDAPALPFLKALGYPVDVPMDWEARLMADPRVEVDDETKQLLIQLIRRVIGT